MIIAAGVEGSNPILNLTIFGLFVVVTLAIVIRVSKRASSGASDFYTAGGGFSGPQNGVAISGDYLSAASFLGIAGAIALLPYCAPGASSFSPVAPARATASPSTAERLKPYRARTQIVMIPAPAMSSTALMI